MEIRHQDNYEMLRAEGRLREERKEREALAHQRQSQFNSAPPLPHGFPPPVVPRQNVSDMRGTIGDLSHQLANSQFADQERRSQIAPSPMHTSPFQRFPSAQPVQSPLTPRTTNGSFFPNANNTNFNSSRFRERETPSLGHERVGQSFRRERSATNQFTERCAQQINERHIMLGTNPPIVDHNDEHDDRDYRDERTTRDPFYGTVSRMTENAIRMLNPLSSLIHALKSPKILNKSTATYVPWSEYWAGVFNSCYLVCLTFIDARHAPDSREAWKLMDAESECIEARQQTSQLLYSGSAPNPSRTDPVLTLNGIFLGVIDVYQAILPTLVNGMKLTLDKAALAHIRDEDHCDSVSLRLMFFNACMIFLAPLGDARETALSDFMNNTVYKINMSPGEFLDKTILKAKAVDKLFQMKQVNDGLLWTVAFNALRKTAGTMYDGCIDRFRTRRAFVPKVRPLDKRSSYSFNF